MIARWGRGGGCDGTLSGKRLFRAIVEMNLNALNLSRQIRATREGGDQSKDADPSQEQTTMGCEKTIMGHGLPPFIPPVIRQSSGGVVR
jgi:hypothetical protein